MSLEIVQNHIIRTNEVVYSFRTTDTYLSGDMAVAQYLDVDYGEYVNILKDFGAKFSRSDGYHIFESLKQAKECLRYIEDNI